MEIQQGIYYYYAQNGQQIGPVEGGQLFQMAQAGQVKPEDFIWTEGWLEWLPAASLHQLLPIFEAQQGYGMQTQFAPATPMGQEAIVKTAIDQTGVLRVSRPGVTGSNLRKTEIRTATQRTAGARPAVYRSQNKGANFGLLLGLWIGALVCVIAGVMVFYLGGGFDSDNTSSPESPIFGILLLGTWLLTTLCLFVAAILVLIYLFRAWQYIQMFSGGQARTTPGKAIGFLFIPLFNIYWFFVAYYGWSEDYNTFVLGAGYHDAPRVVPGLFLTHCILTLLSLPVLLPFIMFQLCNAVNYMASVAAPEAMPR